MAAFVPRCFPPRTKASTSARQILNETSAQLVDGLGGPSATEVLLFALAHGFAKLIEIGRVAPGSGDGRSEKIEDVMAMVNLQGKQE